MANQAEGYWTDWPLGLFGGEATIGPWHPLKSYEVNTLCSGGAMCPAGGDRPADRRAGELQKLADHSPGKGVPHLWSSWSLPGFCHGGPVSLMWTFFPQVSLAMSPRDPGRAL